MPLPALILVTVVSVAGALGVVVGTHALVRNRNAKKLNEEARAIYDEAAETLIAEQEKTEQALERLALSKLVVMNENVKRFVTVLEKIQDIGNWEDTSELENLYKLRIDMHEISILRSSVDMAAEVLDSLAVGETAPGGLNRMLVALGAYGMSTTFGTGKVGTALAMLHVAVSNSTTLTFLGGSALAVGGFGLTGGMSATAAMSAVGSMAILGGLVAGPTLAVLGVFLEKRAGKNREIAFSRLEEAKKHAQSYNEAAQLCASITHRSSHLAKLLERLDEIFLPLIGELEAIIDACGNDYREFPQHCKAAVAMAMSVAGAIKAVLDTPIMTKNGSLDERSEQTATQIESLMETLRVEMSG